PLRSHVRVAGAAPAIDLSPLYVCAEQLQSPLCGHRCFSISLTPLLSFHSSIRNDWSVLRRGSTFSRKDSRVFLEMLRAFLEIARAFLKMVRAFHETVRAFMTGLPCETIQNYHGDSGARVKIW